MGNGPLCRAHTILLSSVRSYISTANHQRSTALSHQVGQRVWLSTQDLPLCVESKKLAPKVIWPFKIQKVVNPLAVRLKLSSSMKVLPTFHVSKVKPPRESPLVPAIPPPSPPRLLDGDPIYTVRRLLRSCRRGRGLQYLVDWKGYAAEERQWVPARSIPDPQLIADFHRQH